MSQPPEDTPMTLEGWRGFPQGVVSAVDALTRRQGESNKALLND
jgi:hypothetical protein